MLDSASLKILEDESDQKLFESLTGHVARRLFVCLDEDDPLSRAVSAMKSPGLSTGLRDLGA